MEIVSLVEWIRENEGYEYYVGRRFLRLFSDSVIERIDDKRVFVKFHNYIILHMGFSQKGVCLLKLNNTNLKGERLFIQEKLFHEYYSFLN